MLLVMMLVQTGMATGLTMTGMHRTGMHGTGLHRTGMLRARARLQVTGIRLSRAGLPTTGRALDHGVPSHQIMHQLIRVG